MNPYVRNNRSGIGIGLEAGVRPMPQFNKIRFNSNPPTPKVEVLDWIVPARGYFEFKLAYYLTR